MRRPDEALRSYLDPDETLRWSGQPRQGVIFRWFDLFAIPFSLLWAGIALAGFGTALAQGGTESVFALFMVPFVLVGAHITVGRFWIEARQRARTAYGVTDERVLIVSGLFRRSAKTLDLRTVSDLTMTERGDGLGTITFGTSPFPAFFQSLAQMQGSGLSIPMFDTIPDVRSVYRLIRDAQQSSRP